MRHIKPSESLVMQEFERIAAASGWMANETEKPAETTSPDAEIPAKPADTTPPEHMAAVVAELVALANDLDQMGEAKAA